MPWDLRSEIDGSNELCGNISFFLMDELLSFSIQNASWSINSLKVYRKQMLAKSVIKGAAMPKLALLETWMWLSICMLLTALLSMT
jgi:hypothetical protein